MQYLLYYSAYTLAVNRPLFAKYHGHNSKQGVIRQVSQAQYIQYYHTAVNRALSAKYHRQNIDTGIINAINNTHIAKKCTVNIIPSPSFTCQVPQMSSSTHIHRRIGIWSTSIHYPPNATIGKNSQCLSLSSSRTFHPSQSPL